MDLQEVRTLQLVVVCVQRWDVRLGGERISDCIRHRKGRFIHLQSLANTDLRDELFNLASLVERSYRSWCEQL
jgi:hypothetical protein